MMRQCPECDREVSDRAAVCPGCGFPLAGQGRQKVLKTLAWTGKRPTKKTVLRWVVAAVACAVVFGVVRSRQCGLSGCRHWRSPGSAYCEMHTCARAGCTNFTSAGSAYCSEHSVDWSAYLQNRESAEAVLKISGVELTSNSLYQICTGTITNEGKDTYSFVKVKGTFEDTSGTVLDTDWTYAVGSEGLAPRESKTFRLSVEKDARIRTCSVSLLDFDRE